MKKRTASRQKSLSVDAWMHIYHGGFAVMIKGLPIQVLFVTLASLIATHYPPENAGTSAVPFYLAAPSKPRPPLPNTRVQEQAASQRTHWPSHNFPSPNGGLLVFTIMADGNPACASYDASGCLWGQSYEQIDFRRVRPLVCGEEHRAKWGVTGYEDPKHWCALARRMQ